MKNIIWLFVAIVMAGCSSSRLTSSWSAPDQSPRQYKKILVLGLIAEPDRTIREKMEQHIVGDLKALGYNAVCSCEEFNPKAFENMTEKEAIAKLSDSGIDAVLTVVLLDKDKEKYYVPGRVYYSPYVIYHRRFWGYYSTMYDRVYSPGYYAVDTKYFWESNFYDLNSKELLYSAQSQSFQPETAASMAHEYGQMIVNDMEKNRILIQQDKPLKSF